MGRMSAWSPMRRARLLWAVALIAAASLTLYSIRRPILIRLGHELVSEDTITAVDLIVIGPDAGDAGVLEAADLVHGGIATRVTIFGEPVTEIAEEFRRRGVDYEDGTARMAHLLRRLGVERVDLVRLTSPGTEETGRVLPLLCQQQNVATVAVVTSADHSRRMRRVLHRSMRGTGVRALVRSSKYSAFIVGRWWQQRAGARRGIVELQKLLLDLMLHPVS